MTKFYEARNAEGSAQWIVAHEESGEHRMFGWLTETRKWHRSTYLEDAFYALTPDMTFVPLTPAATGAKIAAWPKLNRKRVGWLIDELTSLPASEIRSSTQLGLPRVYSSRPATDPQVLIELQNSRGWVIVAKYTGQADGLKAARSLASDIRRGKRKKLAALGALDVQVRPEGHDVLVEAMRIGQKKSA